VSDEEDRPDDVAEAVRCTPRGGGGPKKDDADARRADRSLKSIDRQSARRCLLRDAGGLSDVSWGGCVAWLKTFAERANREDECTGQILGKGVVLKLSNFTR